MSVVFPAAFGPVIMSFLSSVMSFFTMLFDEAEVTVFRKYASFIVVVVVVVVVGPASDDANLHGFSAPDSTCSIIPPRCS